LVTTTTIKDLIQMELDGLYGYDLIHELNEIISYYDIYDGNDHKVFEELFVDENWNMDFHTTKKKHNFVQELLDKANRFMFSNPPTIECLNDDNDTELTKYVNRVLKDNKFGGKVKKAELDCSIGKRVALKVGYDNKRKRIYFRFINSLEFVYEPEIDDSESIKKVIFFYQLNDEQEKERQRIYRQKYEMMDNGQCWMDEKIYDGNGEVVSVISNFSYTGLDFMPVYVILNGGLTGDLSGRSDVPRLIDDQKDYNRLDSGDTDALIKGMFESIYGIDLSAECSKKIKKAPGMYYDLQTDPAVRDADGGKGSVGVLSYNFKYQTALEKKLLRTKLSMYTALDIPLVTPAELQGFVTSGKGLTCLYWDLIIRCNDKMTSDWGPALEWLADKILVLARKHGLADLPEYEYDVVVTPNYALPDDIQAEVELDISKVNAQVMSRVDFLQKYDEVSEKQANETFKQIVDEGQQLENDLSMSTISGDSSNLDVQTVEDPDDMEGTGYGK
jgi:Phage portal protein, SPP1 Gp6-like.